MEQVLGEIVCPYSDAHINESLASLDGTSGAFTRHFTQNEEFFIRLKEPIRVPSFPIHHDVRVQTPDSSYTKALRTVTENLLSQAPHVFASLKHLFDPAEIHRPGFYTVYRYKEMTYLYLLRLDLNYRPNQHRVVEKGSNDVTPVYETQDIVLEPDIIPVEDITEEKGKRTSFHVEQLISQTWIGETGRGYFVQGIWLDRDLTKFFSKLFIPTGTRIYPYFPFTCKYRAICHSLVDLTPKGRERGVPLLHHAREYIRPYMEDIQDDLKQNEFSTELESFQRLKAKVPAHFHDAWSSVQIKAYLNDQEMKEFALD